MIGLPSELCYIQLTTWSLRNYYGMSDISFNYSGLYVSILNGISNYFIESPNLMNHFVRIIEIPQIGHQMICSVSKDGSRGVRP